MSDGSVKSWGDAASGGDSSLVQSRLKNVKALCASWGVYGGGAFAAIVGDEDTVVCWGHKDFGGDCSAVASELKQVVGICGSQKAFAALKRDGTVITWGNTGHGGDNSAVRDRLKGVKAIYSTYFAFAAVLDDGTVEAWGDQERGGLIPLSVKRRLKQVQSIIGNEYAFAALLSDGTVESWGHKHWGGDISKLKGPFWRASQLTQVEAICASNGAFAALRKNGTVVNWGQGDGGLVLPLDRVVALSSTGSSFAAVRSDGSVATWAGEAPLSREVTEELKEVVAICGNWLAFAALRKNGTVVTWGRPDFGGDSSAVRSELVRVVALSSNGQAFTARRSDDTVVTWGNKDCGGDSSSVPALRQVGAIDFKDGWTQREEAARRRELEARQEAEKEEKKNVEKEGSEVMESEKKSEEEMVRLEQEREVQAKAEREAKEREEREILEQRLVRERQEWEREQSRLEHEREARAKAEAEAKENELQRQRQEWERERETLLRERELWQQKTPTSQQGMSSGSETFSTGTTAGNGSVEFWLHTLARLAGVLDEEDMAEAASKLAAAKFKQRHVGKLSQNDLVLAKIAPAVMKDIMDHQHVLLETSNGRNGNSANGEEKHPGGNPISSLFTTSALPRIPEEELAMEEEVGEGLYSVVWRATWTRKVAVGKSGVSSMQVAVKVSKIQQYHLNNNFTNNELARDLAVISSLPHQNILTVHGVCEPSKQKKTNDGGNGGGALKIVYELMSTDLAKLLKLEKDKQQQCPLLPTQLLLRVLRDVSAGLAHLHSHGVIHRDVKPANVLLRGEQVKLCDFGSSKDLQHSIQQMSVAGTLSYMAPEVLNQQPVGRPADVWSFGVLLFECVTGVPCSRAQSTEELAAELSTMRKCLPALVQLFVDCHQADPRKRPSMLSIHTRMQTLVMQEARDSQRLREELKRAEAQDKETYEMTWNSYYANQPHSQELLEYLKHQDNTPQPVRQPLKLFDGKGSMTELQQLATADLCNELHTQLKAIVEECGGTYSWAPRKSSKRCVQKVDQEYDGDFGKLLDLERATGVFGQAEDMLRCLQRVRGEAEDESKARDVVVHMGQALSSPIPPLSLRVLRCKDRMNSPRSSGYRDILLNVCDVESGFIMELQLNFHKIAQINSQSHRFYELLRVMELKLA